MRSIAPVRPSFPNSHSLLPRDRELAVAAGVAAYLPDETMSTIKSNASLPLAVGSVVRWFAIAGLVASTTFICLSLISYVVTKGHAQSTTEVIKKIKLELFVSLFTLLLHLFFA